MNVRYSLVLVACLAGSPTSAQIPAHGHSVRSRAGWACDDGFLRREQSCVAISKATDSEVRQALIAASLATYPGNCPCPYDVDRAGRSCGRRSAYSRPGGRSPRCYESDITDSDVKAFRDRYRAPGGVH